MSFQMAPWMQLLQGGANAAGAVGPGGNDALRAAIMRFLQSAGQVGGGMAETAQQGIGSPQGLAMGGLAGLLSGQNTGATGGAPSPLGALQGPPQMSQSGQGPIPFMPNQEWQQESGITGQPGAGGLAAMAAPTTTPAAPDLSMLDVPPTQGAPAAALPTTVDTAPASTMSASPAPDRQPGANPPGQPAMGAASFGGGNTNEIIDAAINEDPGRAFSLAYGNRAPQLNSILQKQIATYEPRLNDIDAIMGLLSGQQGNRLELSKQLVRGRGEVNIGSLIQQLVGRAQSGDEEAQSLLSTMGGPTGEGVLGLVALSDRQRGKNPALARVKQQRLSGQMNDAYNRFLQGNPTEDQNPMSSWASILAALG